MALLRPFAPLLALPARFRLLDFVALPRLLEELVEPLLEAFAELPLDRLPVDLLRLPLDEREEREPLVLVWAIASLLNLGRGPECLRHLPSLYPGYRAQTGENASVPANAGISSDESGPRGSSRAVGRGPIGPAGTGMQETGRTGGDGLRAAHDTVTWLAHRRRRRTSVARRRPWLLDGGRQSEERLGGKDGKKRARIASWRSGGRSRNRCARLAQTATPDTAGPRRVRPGMPPTQREGP